VTAGLAAVPLPSAALPPAALVTAPGGEDAEAVVPVEEEAAQVPPAAQPASATAAVEGLTIGVDEALRRSGTALRNRLLQEQPAPPEVVRGEVAEGEERLIAPADRADNVLAGRVSQPAGRPAAVADAAEAAPRDDPATLWDLLLTAGLVSAVYSSRRFLQGETNRPARQRGRATPESPRGR
jgi:hypothetical protein